MERTFLVGVRLEWSYASPRLALPALSQPSLAQASCPGAGVQAQAVTVGYRLSSSRGWWFCEGHDRIGH